MGIQTILQLINLAIPNVANLIVAIRNANGTVDIGVQLSAADSDYQKTIDGIQAYIAAHPATAKPA